MELTTLAQESSATLSYLIKAITSDLEPEIETSIDETLNAVTLSIVAPENQLGQIIGKEGKIIKSLRLLISIAYPNQRINLQIKNS